LEWLAELRGRAVIFGTPGSLVSGLAATGPRRPPAAAFRRPRGDGRGGEGGIGGQGGRGGGVGRPGRPRRRGKAVGAASEADRSGFGGG
jgi:hypothetical protein